MQYQRVPGGPKPSRPPWHYVAGLAAVSILMLLASHHSSPAAPALAAARKQVSAYLPDPFNDPLAYRRLLETTTSPTRQIEHHPTLGFSHIYVLSLPTRTDRRDEMRKLADALGVEITFVDAARKEEPFIQWIGERVVESREKRRAVMAKARRVNPSEIGGLAVGTDWFTTFVDNIKRRRPFPDYPPDERFSSSGGSWTAYLEASYDAGEHTSLRATNDTFDLAASLYDPLEEHAVRQVHEGIISTYWGQTRALKEVIRNGDESALIMEDDVDVEWDVERLWSRMARKFPDEWDVSFLGHCWSHESLTPWYAHPLLHPSVAPMCLHGWVVTAAGAQRIFDALLDPWSAFSTAVDLTLPTLILEKQVTAFSVQPPLIIQRKDGPSDLQKGKGSKWRGVLRDSTVERIARDEGRWLGDEEWDPNPKTWDPAIRFREIIDCKD